VTPTVVSLDPFIVIHTITDNYATLKRPCEETFRLATSSRGISSLKLRFR